MRVAIVTTSVAGLLMLAGWAAGASSPLPPKCSPADAQGPEAQAYSETRYGGFYLRFCGSGRAVVGVGGKSFTIKGGYCYSGRRVGFGVLGIGIGRTPAARAFWGTSRGRGVSLVMEYANRPGRNDIIGGDIQLPGVSYAETLTGTAIVAKGLKSATFSIRTPGHPARITGRWTCGA